MKFILAILVLIAISCGAPEDTTQVEICYNADTLKPVNCFDGGTP